MSNIETVFVDGSTGEGGGQILRTSLALACITGKSLHIENIRAARRNPGLAKQHLSCVQAACQISNGKCQGATQGSKVLDFQPGQVQGGDFHFDIGSAGSATLVGQTVLPALFLADPPFGEVSPSADRSSKVTITGGTHNPLAPPFDFICETFLPALATAGFLCNCKLIKHGFFPAGGGKITFDVWPRQEQSLQTINLCQSSRQFQINAKIFIAKLPAHIAQRQQKLLLQSKLDIENVEQVEVTDSDGPGNCAMIRLCGSSHTTVFTAFGMRGKSSENVISEVVNLVEDFLGSGAAIDRFLADQLLVYMAIAKAGCYTTDELSTHLLTNIEVIKKFLTVDFQIDRDKGTYKVSCHPI